MRCKALVSGVALALSAPPAVAAPPMPVRLAVPLVDGQPFDLAQEAGHVVIVHAWATWCAPCHVEMPMLDRFARAHGDVVVLALSADSRRDLPAVRRMAAGMAFRVGMASATRVNTLGAADVLPQTWVMDGKGRVVAHFGLLKEGDLEAGLARAR